LQVTVEKGQGFNDPNTKDQYAEPKIIAQLAAVKARDPSICTVFYMNSVLSWYFYEMDVTFRAHPEQWLYDSADGKPVKTSGDHTFNPPKDGMLVFDHSKLATREFWEAVCVNATATGAVDGCFSDSSSPHTHRTNKFLNASDDAAFEAGKVQTMAAVTAKFGGKAGQPYGDSTGVLIGKKSNQSGINALQIEMFNAEEQWIVELRAAVQKGYLVQAHVTVNDPVSKSCGCKCMEDSLAAFLIAAGDDSYYGSGLWISPTLADVQQRWCPPLFERALGEPLADGVKGADGVWRRAFKSGTKVTFDSGSNKGKITWGTR
jgi:hypothetical protein